MDINLRRKNENSQCVNNIVSSLDKNLGSLFNETVESIHLNNVISIRGFRFLFIYKKYNNH